MKAGEKAKHALKQAVKHSVITTGMFHTRQRQVSRILTYHSVGYRNHEMNVLPEDFRAQMTLLAETGGTIALADAARGCSGVAVTFDDGYRDNLLHAAPVLAEYGIPAVVFMVAGCAGSLLPHDTDEEHARLLSWVEVRELERMGIGIGSHTLSHRRLSTLPLEAQQKEICQSRKILEQELGHAVDTFAYPYGSAMDYTQDSIRLVREAGYALAVSNRYGVNGADADPFELRRIWIDRTDSLALFRAKVQGRLDGLALLDSAAGIRIRKMLNRGLGA